ncbi:MAG: cation:proton antiporter [Anaerolineae bacterium]|nr:cation:proton antiporter [Anaerolineae bacterium]
MELLLSFTLALAIVVLAAKTSGYLSSRLGQPAVLGELLIGLILGPTVLNILDWPLLGDGHLEETFHQLAHLGVLLLMFIAGLEVDLESMLQTGRPALLAGVLGVVTPILLGALAILPFGFGLQDSLAIGLVLAATSVSISAQTLMELGVLRSRVGMTLLGAAVVDDILAILLLSLFLALATGGGGGALAIIWVLVRMIAFLGIAAALGALLIPRLAGLVDDLPISEGLLALAFVVALIYGWAAEALGGVAGITGAFLAGILFARTTFRRSIEARMRTLAYAWLVPVFFVSIGLSVNARGLDWNDLLLALVITAVALLSKLLGAGLGARWGGFSIRESLQLGVGMMSRGEVGLIVATAEIDANMIENQLFADVVIMVLVTTLITPIVLRALYPKAGRPAQPPEA